MPLGTLDYSVTLYLWEEASATSLNSQDFNLGGCRLSFRQNLFAWISLNFRSCMGHP